MTFENKKAVLISGGLDSFALLDQCLKTQAAVYPIYVSKGLHWEKTELEYIQQYLESFSSPNNLYPLKILKSPFDDILPEHWSYTGKNIPDQNSPDEAVEIPLRNLQFLSKASLYCIKKNIHQIYLGILKNNPFPDASPEFFSQFEKMIQIASHFSIEIKTPFKDKSKLEVIQNAKDLPLHLTFSCLQPQGHLHCGQCNKCIERKLGFQKSSVQDKTQYHSDFS